MFYIQLSNVVSADGTLSLSSEDLAKFRVWFLELDHQLWDRQIEVDFRAGKLDHLINEARAELKAGKTREL